jgi:hypothetical protein
LIIRNKPFIPQEEFKKNLVLKPDEKDKEEDKLLNKSSFLNKSAVSDTEMKQIKDLQKKMHEMEKSFKLFTS